MSNSRLYLAFFPLNCQEKSPKQISVPKQSKEVCLNVQRSEKCPVNNTITQFMEIEGKTRKSQKRLKENSTTDMHTVLQLKK